ncbi:deoxyribonuclease V [Pseudanabaenaceae cyanobacterium LEGE 13415]|nr:deoxyribonuclease V [Pseudanabaenaceae cyanobacterium LEGE 13415]
MNRSLLNSTPPTAEAAIALQQELRSLVIQADDFGTVQTVAGVDVGFEQDDRIACAAIAVLNFPDLTLQESVAIRRSTTFPYIPGLLGFRQVPIVMEALATLKTQPSLLLCDGNGYIHPRRCGFACHLGVVSGLPSIGVAKTPYLGSHEPVAEHRGAWQPIYDADEVIGAVVRTQAKVKPVYVSVGHRIGLESAIDIVLCCASKYRLPETTRQADQLSKGHTTAIAAKRENPETDSSQ